MRTKIAVLGLSAALVAGGAGLAVALPAISSAQSEDTTTTTPADQDGARTSHLADVLAPLVADGTLTQDQADAVVAALEAAGPRGGGHGHDGMGRGGPRLGLDAAATALGVSQEELVTALRDGQSIADLAAARGVDVQVVIEAMVADAEAHLAEEVAEGDLTQEEADARTAELTAKVTELVDGTLPLGPDGPDGPDGRGGHGGRGGMHGDGEADEDAPATTAPSGFATSGSASVRPA
ncbi:MAG: hypothetical protein MUE36_04640 [Acidimicrobiales bacterium]|nr:hypothetical protein [Acidimicrobiales bacterium]